MDSLGLKYYHFWAVLGLIILFLYFKNERDNSEVLNNQNNSPIALPQKDTQSSPTTTAEKVPIPQKTNDTKTVAKEVEKNILCNSIGAFVPFFCL